MRLAVLLMLCVAFTPYKAHAWGGDGHRIICAIAWDEMTSVTRGKVSQLLGVDDREGFAETCTWADEYRSHGHRETAQWHFLNIPPNALKVDLKRDCSGRKSCVVAQIEKDRATLRNEAHDDERVTALKFLSHFVGDIHQPLHISHAEDKGGNAVEGRFMKRKANLHEVWDSLLLRNTHKAWAQVGTELKRALTDKQRRAWADSTPLEWAQESLEITNAPSTQYRNDGRPFSLGAEYQKEGQTIVFRRLSQAGVRLAQTLNETLSGHQ